jgi:tetratricopeptide (TPR) repeat protein
LNPVRRELLLTSSISQGRTRESEALAEYSMLRDVARSGSDPLVTSIAGYACAVAGQQAEALLLLKRLLDPPPQRYVDPYTVATLYSALGQRDKAFDWLERTYQQRSASVVFINFDPLFSSFHSDPRFQDLIRRAGLPFRWRLRILCVQSTVT